MTENDLKIFVFSSVLYGRYTNDYTDDLCVIAKSKGEAITIALMRGDNSEEEATKIREANVYAVEIADALMFRVHKNQINFESLGNSVVENGVYSIPASYLTTVEQMHLYIDQAATANVIDWHHVRFASNNALALAIQQWGKLANVNISNKWGANSLLAKYEIAVKALQTGEGEHDDR